MVRRFVIFERRPYGATSVSNSISAMIGSSGPNPRRAFADGTSVLRFAPIGTTDTSCRSKSNSCRRRVDTDHHYIRSGFTTRGHIDRLRYTPDTQIETSPNVLFDRVCFVTLSAKWRDILIAVWRPQSVHS